MNSTNNLIKKYKEGDKNALTLLIENNKGLVHSIINRYTHHNIEYEDLYQIGIMGLIKAIKNFDLNLNYRLSTYAVIMINGEIKQYFRNNGPIKVSRYLKSIYYQYLKEKDLYYKNKGSDCKLETIASKIGVSTENLILAINANESVMSLDKPIGDDSDNKVNYYEKIENPKLNPENNIERLNLLIAIDSLQNTEKKVLKLRYILNKTQKETGEILNCSQVSVSRIEKKILNKIKEKIC